MECWLFRMRSYGSRLAATSGDLKTGLHGWFEFSVSTRELRRGKSSEAHFLDRQGGRNIARPLYNARLVRAGGVLHIAGYEDLGRQQTKSSPAYYPQSWLLAWRQIDALRLIEKIQSKSLFDDPNDDDGDGVPFPIEVGI